MKCYFPNMFINFKEITPRSAKLELLASIIR